MKNLSLIDDEVVIGKNVTIDPFNIIKGKTIIHDNCHIKSFNYIENCEIFEDCTVEQSNLVNSVVGKGCVVGPFARLREHALVGENCRVGNFVEIKKSTLGNGVKASHLAYLGDCDVGDLTNVGCGAIFVNYDGKTKHHTSVGKNSFIGSNCNIIAPVKIAEGSYICAGTTVTKDTMQNDFVIGRCRPEVKSNLAKKYLGDKK